MKILLKLSNDRNLYLQGITWDRFLKDLNDEKAYIEQNMIEADGSGETFVVMKNQIITAYRQTN